MKLDDHPQYTKEALDPVGKEDGDVDNDGDKDSSDKHLLKRRKAIGKAMKKRMRRVSILVQLDYLWKDHFPVEGLRKRQNQYRLKLLKDSPTGEEID